MLSKLTIALGKSGRIGYGLSAAAVAKGYDRNHSAGAARERGFLKRVPLRSRCTSEWTGFYFAAERGLIPLAGGKRRTREVRAAMGFLLSYRFARFERGWGEQA